MIPGDSSRQRAEQPGKESKRVLEELKKIVDSFGLPDAKRIVVNKRTHRVRFENETEGAVTIEKRGTK